MPYRHLWKMVMLKNLPEYPTSWNALWLKLYLRISELEVVHVALDALWLQCVVRIMLPNPLLFQDALQSFVKLVAGLIGNAYFETRKPVTFIMCMLNVVWKKLKRKSSHVVNWQDFIRLLREYWTQTCTFDSKSLVFHWGILLGSGWADLNDLPCNTCFFIVPTLSVDKLTTHSLAETQESTKL